MGASYSAVGARAGAVAGKIWLFDNEWMSQTDFDPEYVFSHHSATAEKLAHYDAIHEGAKRFAEVVLAHVPECADRLSALSLRTGRLP